MKSCKFYYLSIRGLKSKIESQKNKIIEEKPEVIGIVETMLDAKYIVVMEAYTIYRNYRSREKKNMDAKVFYDTGGNMRPNTQAQNEAVKWKVK